MNKNQINIHYRKKRIHINSATINHCQIRDAYNNINKGKVVFSRSGTDFDQRTKKEKQ